MSVADSQHTHRVNAGSTASARSVAEGGTATASRRRRYLIGLALVLVCLVLASCGTGSDKPLDTLDPIGDEAKTIDRLVRPVFMTAIVIFFLVEGAIVFVIARFRRRRSDAVDADEWPAQVHGNVKLELGWTVLPAVIIGVIGIFTVATVFELEERDANALEVDVYGHQWWWSFEYDIDDDGVVDFTTANEMVVPTGRQVDLTIHSRDVIHSFWIPRLNGKRDAVPGREHTLSLQTDQAGMFRGQCTEFCGLSHARMQMYVDARTPDDYEAWVQQQLQPAAVPEEGSAASTGLDVFRTYCQSCHLVRGGNLDASENLITELGEFGGPESTLKAGWAPELTHLMSRRHFAGAILDLYNDDGSVNTAELEAWIRDPASMKPADADAGRGMPDRGLSEDEIDQVVAYLMTLE